MLSIAERIASMKETELFRDASPEDLEKVAAAAQEVHFTGDQTIFHEGDKGDAVYFIVRGRLKVHKSGVEIVRLKKGECFGEMAVMDEGPRSASVSSIGNVLLLRISRDDFISAVQSNAQLLKNVLKIVVGKLRGDIDREIKAVRDRERMMQDLARASELQMSMLPTRDLQVTTVNGLSLEASGHCYPAEKVGGDYYDYFPLPDNRVGIVIGDVMGHGFHTALMVSTAKSCLHTQMRSDYSIIGVMSAMNDMVYGFVHGNHPLFMSFCYMIIDLQDHTISFSNAGHPYPYHYHAGIKQLDVLESNACPLGVLEYQDYEVGQSEWGADDILVLYTDGIIEAQNRKGEDFSEEKLKQLVIENAHLSPAELKKAILQELDNFCQGVVQADDVSMAIVRMGA